MAGGGGAGANGGGGGASPGPAGERQCLKAASFRRELIVVQKVQRACWELEDKEVCAVVMGKAGHVGAGRCAGACRMLAGVYRSEPIVYDPVLCEFEAPFDRNGVLYHIGTRGGTRELANPHLSGEVVAAMSSLIGSCGALCGALSGRVSWANATGN